MANHLLSFFKGLLALFALAFAEKLLFAVHHDQLRETLSTQQVAAALLGGLHFDLAVATALALPAYLVAYLLYRLLRLPLQATFRRTLYVAAILLVALHGGDLMYFAEAGRHLGYEIGETANSGSELLVTAITGHFWLLLLQLVVMAASVMALRRLLKDGARRPNRRAPRLLPELQLIVVLCISVILLRGGLQSVALEPLRAQALGGAQQATLGLNGAYNALFFLMKNDAVPRVLQDAPSDDDLVLLRAMYADQTGPTPVSETIVPPNIVLVFLESWSAVYMASYGYEQETTPHFDALRQRSLSTYGMLAGGRRTTEGMFATLCSAQNPLGGSVAQTPLQEYHYDCLPNLLRNHGYHTAFFQGTNSETSGTGSFAQLLGFTESYGKEHLGKPQIEPNSWGLHDPDLYRESLEKMRAMAQPFLIGINTNSTHDQHLPPDAERPFDQDTRLGRYLNTLHYADQALADFIRDVETDPTLANTIFVLVADHAGLAPPSGYQQHLVPFAIYEPGAATSRITDEVASQRDIAPTLLQLLGHEPAPWFSGKSLLSSATSRFADYYHNGQLGWVENEQLVTIPVGRPEGFKCYDYRRASGTTTPVPCNANVETAKERALTFTRSQQGLLFSGRLKDVTEWKKGKETN